MNLQGIATLENQKTWFEFAITLMVEFGRKNNDTPTGQVLRRHKRLSPSGEMAYILVNQLHPPCPKNFPRVWQPLQMHCPCTKGSVYWKSGAAAREVAGRIGSGHILAIDRSEKAIEQAVKSSQKEIESGRLSFRRAAIEDFEREPDEPLFDLAFAVRVGALDGRHPETGELAFPRIAKALTPDGKLFIDGGNPLKEISLKKYQ